MSTEAIVGIIALVFTGIAGLLFIGRLLGAVENLTKAVGELRETIERIEDKAADHDGRIRVLEAQSK